MPQYTWTAAGGRTLPKGELADDPMVLKPYILELEARAEKAEAEVERLRIGNAALAANVRVAEAVAEKAEAEVERLRAALHDETEGHPTCFEDLYPDYTDENR